MPYQAAISLLSLTLNDLMETSYMTSIAYDANVPMGEKVKSITRLRSNEFRVITMSDKVIDVPYHSVLTFRPSVTLVDDEKEPE